MIKKIIYLLLCLALAATMLVGCADTKENAKITLVLDWTPNTNHTGIFIAKDQGYYAAEGLDIEIIQPPEGGALSFVAAGKADFAISFQEEVMVAANAENPLPVMAIASVLEHNTGGIMSLKEKGVLRFKDMEGKTYGSWQVPIYDEIIKACVEADGGDPSKITFVPNGATDSISGIQRDFGTVWVYEGWEKMIADLQGVETNFISIKDINPVFDYYSPVIVTSENTIEKKRDMVVKFLAATEKGYTDAKEKPSEAADILIKYAPETDEETIRASQDFLSGQYFSSKWGYIDEGRWNAFFDWMKDKGLLSGNAQNKAFENIE